MTGQDSTLPEYEVDQTHSLPVYSAQAGSSECLLQFEPSQRTGCPACEWVFETKRFKLNLGRKMWKLNSPTYGLHGKVDGALELLDPALCIQRIQATVEGRLRLTCPDKRATVEHGTFFAHTVDIPYDRRLAETPFSISIPPTLKLNGKVTPTPPSFFYSDKEGYVLDLSYYIRFDVTCQVGKRRKTDSRLVGFYYLPKTNPQSPSILSLPPASRHLENPPLFLLSPERIRSFPLSPIFKAKATKRPRSASLLNTSLQATKLKHLKNAIYLSLPNPSTFTSGETMPFMLSLCFPNEPCIPELLCASVSIHLFRRLGIAVRPSTPAPPAAPVDYSERSTLVSSATLRKNSGWAEGVVVLKGEIQMGDPGAETTWSLPGLAYAKYVIRVSLQPPQSLSSHIPAFVHEEEIRLYTSSWGTLEREMLSGGGTTTPAVGLCNSLRRIY